MSPLRIQKAQVPGKKLKTKTESKTLLAENINRSGFIVSAGTKDVTIALGPTAVNGEGIVIREKGPPFVLMGYTGPVSIIASAEEPEIGYAEF